MFSCVGGFINLILHCRTTASADIATLGGFFFFSSRALPDMQINTAIRTATDKAGSTELDFHHPVPSISFWESLRFQWRALRGHQHKDSADLGQMDTSNAQSRKYEFLFSLLGSIGLVPQSYAS